MTETSPPGATTTDLAPLEEITREELYDMIWREPMLRIGERLGLSSSYLTRVCVALRVPRPPMGHWTKVEFGLPSPQLPLPAARPGDPVVWSPPVLRPKPQRQARRIAPSTPEQAEEPLMPDTVEAQSSDEHDSLVDAIEVPSSGPEVPASDRRRLRHHSPGSMLRCQLSHLSMAFLGGSGCARSWPCSTSPDTRSAGSPAFDDAKSDC